MTLTKTREEYISDGLRTWVKDAGAMSVMCEGPAEEQMIKQLNKEYDDIIKREES